MSAPIWIDELFAVFVGTLPEADRALAAGLAATLGLAPSCEVGWSQVFSHEVTLAAPALVSEAMPGLAVGLVREATLAHTLAVIEAFGTDRIEDGQVASTPGLVTVLESVRRARDAAVERVAAAGAGEPPSQPPYAVAEQETLGAIHAERSALRGGAAVEMERYLSISSGKQRVGLPASLALARAAGWDANKVRVLASLLDDVWVGLQLHDDVIDWEDDLKRGGAWAVSLAATVQAARPPGETRPASVRRLVYQSGVLARMLGVSSRRFRAARRRAGVLGAARLAAWAAEREAYTRELAHREAESPGFANRAHALASWARTVLA